MDMERKGETDMKYFSRVECGGGSSRVSFILLTAVYSPDQQLTRLPEIKVAREGISRGEVVLRVANIVSASACMIGSSWR
jgi:hypothetical protein